MSRSRSNCKSKRSVVYRFRLTSICNLTCKTSIDYFSTEQRLTISDTTDPKRSNFTNIFSSFLVFLH